MFENMSKDELVAKCYQYKNSLQSLNNKYTKEVGRNIRLEGEVDKLKGKNGELSARNCQLSIENKCLRSKQGTTTGSTSKATFFGETDARSNKKIDSLQSYIDNVNKVLKSYGIEVDYFGNVVVKQSIWTSEKLLATLPKSDTEEVRYRLVKNEFGYFVDIRIYKNDKPTRKGLCFKPQFVSDFNKTLDVVIEML
jgi:hypothetical protein